MKNVGHRELLWKWDASEGVQGVALYYSLNFSNIIRMTHFPEVELFIPFEFSSSIEPEKNPLYF